MATLALSVAGQFVGGAVGGPIGATIGRALGALAGSAVDQAIFSEPEAPRQLADLRLQGSSEGGPIPRVYGWGRLAGNIIWATQLELSDEASSGGKGFGGDGQGNGTDGPVYLANFAVGLCEGHVHRIGRIWADGRVLDPSHYTIRTYFGDEDQSADALITAKQGANKTPTYRGLCYLVFEALPLGEFGNRIPNITVEVCRVVGELENQIRAITIIPGATEFGYDPEPRVRLVSSGVTALENTHLFGQTSDWTYSLDELQALCSNLSHVALVVAWFGDDLRCGQCKIQPRVEGANRDVIDADWVVSGQNRSDVPVMSTHDGGAAYGGTPSDTAVLAAIADLKARGIAVTLYPIVLMDVPEANGLTDPYTGASDQPAYPWRGRITCDPAPGEVGSPDMSGAVNAEVSNFLGSAADDEFSNGAGTINFSGGADWGFRRMILHYAHLCELAGGVDALLIGSEMRGMSYLRSAAASFPFVDGLVDLAADVRAVAGLDANITYAADWSEYAGFQPPETPGDKLFHLDKLWASADINAVGIDNYMPAADWRGPGLGPDGDVVTSPYRLDYLDANIGGGEGFEWYYASAADRNAGTRTPIADAAHSEPWVWRVKDLTGWWQNAHHNRINGVRQVTATDWVPESKPIWFTELGCGAVDKGANQPNVFGDSKSYEDARPYFSDGSPDALVQRQFLRAHHRHWQPDQPGFENADNPVSAVYGTRMVDPERIYCWTWDARPFPAFPQLTDVWSDGANHQIGHWLTGRLGAAASDELIAAMAADYDVPLLNANAAGALVSGIQVGNVSSMRAAASPLWAATGITITCTPDGLEFLAEGEGARLDLKRDECAILDGPVVKRAKPNSDEVPGQLSLAYFDRDHDYQSASVVAIADPNPQMAAESSNLVLNAGTARTAAEIQLRRKTAAETIALALPPSLQAVEPGDRINLAEVNDGPFMIDTVRIGTSLDITGRVQRAPLIASFAAAGRVNPPQIPQSTAVPVVLAAHLPGVAGNVSPTQLVFGAFAQPWPGTIRITRSGQGEIARLNAVATIGELTDDLDPGVSCLWDDTDALSAQLYSGHLSSVADSAVLDGANRMAVLHDDGAWEVLGFANAELIGPSSYILSRLLRGRGGTDYTLASTASAGNPVMLLNSALAQTPIAVGDLGSEYAFTRFAGAVDVLGETIDVALDPAPALPLAPTALSALRVSGTDDISFSWIRRSRSAGNSWTLANLPLDYTPESYRLRILDGETLIREVIQLVTTFTYTDAMQTEDIGELASDLNFTVEQISAVLGPGHTATGAFHNA